MSENNNYDNIILKNSQHNLVPPFPSHWFYNTAYNPFVCPVTFHLNMNKLIIIGLHHIVPKAGHQRDVYGIL